MMSVYVFGGKGSHPQPTADDNVNDNVDNIDSEYEIDIYLLREKPPRVKPSRVSPSQINFNDSLQSWLDNDNIIVNVSFRENFRCVIACPSECGNTFLLKNLFLSCIPFDRLYIFGPTGDQYEGLKYEDIEFIKEIKDLPSPDQLPKDIKILMIFDDVWSKEPVINEYFCRGRHSNFNMIYLKQSTFSADRQNVRENSNLFIFFEQRGRATTAIYHDFFNRAELRYDDSNKCEKVW